MFEALKKKSIKKSLAPAIILLVIGFLLAGVQIPSAIAILKGHQQFEELTPYEIKGNMIVDVNLSVNLGAFIEEWEENTTTHVTKTTDMWYVIWTGDEDDMDYRFMGIKVPASEISKMDEMCEAYYYGEYFEPIQYSGNIQKMDKEELSYFEDFFLESGMTEEELEDWILPYYINVGALTGGSAVTVWVFVVIGLVLIAIGIIIMILAMTGGKLKALKKELEALGISESEAEYEYESSPDFYNGTEIRIGRRLIFYMMGSTPHVLLKDKLVWAYQNTTTHRTNGIKTGTTYSVVLNTIEKKSMHLSVASEAQAVNILQYINQDMPWVVVGYNDDIRRLYNGDFQNFLQMLYYKVKNGQNY